MDKGDEMKLHSTWTHANGNMIAAVDTETTGLRSGYHDMIQIAILPLTPELKPSGIKPFNLTIRPDDFDRIDMRAMRVNKISFEELRSSPCQEDAFFIFENWVEEHVVGNNFKKILPIGQNIQFDMGFIKEWAGWDSKNPGDNYSEDFFEWRKARDTKYVAEFLNDLAWEKNLPLPFGRTSLNSLSSKLNGDYAGAHDALTDCRITAKVYRRLMRLMTNLEFGAVDENE